MLLRVGVNCLQLLPLSNNWSLLISQVLAGVITYAAPNRIFRMAAFLKVVDVLRGKLKLHKPWLFF